MIRLAAGLAFVLAACAAPAQQATTTTEIANDATQPTNSVDGAVARPASSQTAPSASDVASVKPPPQGPFGPRRVREIVRDNYDAIGACYLAGLDRDPKLKGTISVKLAISGRGTVVSANAPQKPPTASPPKATERKKKPYWKRKAAPPKEEVLTDPGVVTCVEDVFKRLRFPPTGRGLVNLVYPVVLNVE